MLKIDKNQISNTEIPPFSYIKPRGGILGRAILTFTRWLRAINARRYMQSADRHLDIGCGDGYFLKRSKCQECFGLDKLFGDNINSRLEFPDNYFDYVTMLAVIEHIDDPEPLIAEITRVLKPGGKLIITTPQKIVHIFLRIYIKDIDSKHVCYYNLESIIKLTKGNFMLKAYQKFLFGLNQVFCLEKKHD